MTCEWLHQIFSSRQRDALVIRIHELTLPDDGLEVEAVVFELDVPIEPLTRFS